MQLNRLAKCHGVMRIILLICVCLAMASCLKEKQQPAVRTFYASLPIVKTETADSVSAGQNITSKVFCSLPSTSGKVSIYSFDIRQQSPREYDIAVVGYFENWDESRNVNVIWTADSTMKLPTQLPGQYVLRFYTGNGVTQTDSVVVY